MKTVVGKFGFLALCATALTAIGQPAHANTLDFGGSPLTIVPTPLYSAQSASNNVVNSPGSPPTGSVLTDPTGPNLSVSTPWVMNGYLSTTLSNYTVNWFYAGSESGYAITFSAPGLTGGTGPYTEHDNNNNCISGCNSSGTIAPVFMGTTTNSLAFSLNWQSGSVNNNGSTNDPSSTPGNGAANLLYAYLQPNSDSTAFSLTTTPTNWFAFALNDNGGGDNDHDDFVGFGQILAAGGGNAGSTPIPAALPLFGCVLGGGFLMRKWRKRHKDGAQPVFV